MAPAHKDVASGGRRRNLSWVTLFCFGSRRERGQDQEASSAEGTTPWERSSRRRKKRTVPVDGDLVGTAADSEVMMRRGSDEEEPRKRKGLRLPGCCCFLPPARAPGREHSAMDSSSGRDKQRHPERTEPPPPPRSQSDKNLPSEASQIQATAGGSNSNGSRSRGAEQPRRGPAETTRAPTTKPCGSATSSKTGAGVGAFGPVVGLSVVVAVSMAGLLGGRLWAVACVCAWLAALSRLRRTAAEEAAVDVDSTDHKELVVLRGLLERDRRKAVAAA